MDVKDLRLERLEKRTLRVQWLLLAMAATWVLTIGLIIIPDHIARQQAQQAPTPQSLKVSELVVVDPKGTERVRIGGDLPDAVINGKKVPRGEKAAGLVLYDAGGQERSGYVTFEPSGNVGLTLDTRKSQAALFVAGPDEGSAMQLWSDRDVIEFRSDSDGSRMTAVKDGQVVTQQPAIEKISAATCEIYRGARARVSAEQVMKDCRRRFAEAPCSVCLAK
jgi:hypothetical protein